MSKYDDSLIVKDALQIYFSQYHFKDGGYNDKWFKIKLGSGYIPLPNIKSRVDAVKIHDIHHLITEYNADYKGEAEIGAWEIAGGCEKFSVAWLLNLGSFLIGIFLYPRSLLRAFLRGRKCKTNLYFNTKYDDVLLNKTLGELRKKIGIDTSSKYSAADYFAFVLWCAIALCYHLLIVAAFIWVVVEAFKFLF